MKALNTLTAYVIGVLIVWAAIFAVGYYRNGSTPGYPILHVFGGFILGMLSMYIATRVYPRRARRPSAQPRDLTGSVGHPGSLTERGNNLANAL
jgi:hypothetical protein